MANHTQIRALVVGVEGIFVRFADLAPLRRWEQRLGLSPRHLIADILESPSSTRACLGLMKDADVWMELACLHYRLHADEVAALAADFWATMQVDTKLLDFMQSLRPRLRVAALGNAWPGARDRYMRTHAIAEYLDTVVLSSEEGLVMPDTRIYEVATARLGVSPGEALFVDASRERLDGARDAGMQVLPFIGSEQLVASLGPMLATDPDCAELVAGAAS